MSEAALEALVEKREELVAQVRTLHSQIFTINETIRLLGHDPGTKRAPFSRFAKGELIALVGRAERDGMERPLEIAEHIIQSKGWDVTDKSLKYRIRLRVSDCLKRLRVREKHVHAPRKRQLEGSET